jgi:hypothetical protein
MSSKPLSNFRKFCANAFEGIKKNTKRGIEWTGSDGLINMETGALLVLFFRIIFPFPCCAVVSFLIMGIKCAFDSCKGHKNEKHDFICAFIGVLCGVMLSMAHAAVIIL